MKHLLALFISASLFFAPFNMAEQGSVKIEGARVEADLGEDCFDSVYNGIAIVPAV